MPSLDNITIYDALASELCLAIETAQDPSPMGAFNLTENDGGHDSEFRCKIALNCINMKNLTQSQIILFFDHFIQSSLLNTRRLKLVAHILHASLELQFFFDTWCDEFHGYESTPLIHNNNKTSIFEAFWWVDMNHKVDFYKICAKRFTDHINDIRSAVEIS